jgi:hypothetical protein
LPDVGELPSGFDNTPSSKPNVASATEAFIESDDDLPF